MTLMSLETKFKYVVFTPCATAPLSLLGSILTLVTIYRTRILGDRLTTYHRLVIGLAIFDCCLSSAVMMGPLPIPNVLEFPGGHGTQATCTLQAFVVNLGTGSFTYSAMLMWYYVLVIRFNVRSETMTKRIEPWMHGITIGWHLSQSIAGLVLGVFGPGGTFCHIGGWPMGCEDPDNDDDIVCERASAATIELYGLWLTVVPFMMWNILIVIALGIIGGTVMIRYQKSRQYIFEERCQNLSQEAAPRTSTRFSRFFWTPSKMMSPSPPPPPDQSRTQGGGPLSDPNNDNNRRCSSVTNNGNGNNTNNSRNAAMKEVITQCILYALCFINVMVWSTLGTIFGIMGKSFILIGRQFWIACFSTFFFPIQGLFLFVIFLRPRYKAIRRQQPNLSLGGVIRQAIWFPITTTRGSSRNAHHHHNHHNRGSSTGSTGRSHTAPTSHMNKPSIEDGVGGEKKEKPGAIGEVVFEEPEPTTTIPEAISEEIVDA